MCLLIDVTMLTRCWLSISAEPAPMKGVMSTGEYAGAMQVKYHGLFNCIYIKRRQLCWLKPCDMNDVLTLLNSSSAKQSKKINLYFGPGSFPDKS